jgi:hypothetical protein
VPARPAIRLKSLKTGPCAGHVLVPRAGPPSPRSSRPATRSPRSSWWHVPLLALATRFAGSRRVIVPVPRPDQGDIRFVGDLIENGAFAAVIDRRYPLEAIVDAYRYVDTGQKTGNVIITVA